MMSHLNGMKNFIRAVETQVIEEDIFLDNLGDDFDISTSNLVESLEEALFKLESYYNPNHSKDYREGVQEGLNYAIDVLTRIIESHKN